MKNISFSIPVSNILLLIPFILISSSVFSQSKHSILKPNGKYQLIMDEETKRVFDNKISKRNNNVDTTFTLSWYTLDKPDIGLKLQNNDTLYTWFKSPATV